MPQASGVALGLDRLVMLATGATHIDQVQWTPVDTAGLERDAMNDMTPDHEARGSDAPPSGRARRRRPDSAGARRGAGGSRRALRRRDHAGDGGADRPADPHDPIARQFVPDAARARRRRRKSAPIRSATMCTR